MIYRFYLTEVQPAIPSASAASGLSPDARRMLDAIEALPEDEREVFDLVGIQGIDSRRGGHGGRGFREVRAAAPEPGPAPAGGTAGRPSPGHVRQAHAAG